MRNISRLAIIVAFCAGVIYAQEFSVAGANAYRSRQDWNGLLQYCQRWTRSQPNEAMGWYYLGSTYGLGFKQPANAVAPFQKAVELKPDWALVWNALGFTYMDLKRYDDAAGAFRKCVEFEPSKANYWNSLASAYSPASRTARDRSLQVLSTSIRLTPCDAWLCAVNVRCSSSRAAG